MIFYAFYNAGLLELSPPNSKDESQFGFIDDVALLATGENFEEMHRKLKSMMEHHGGAFDWSKNHYSHFELTKLALMDFSPKSPAGTPLSISWRGSDDTTVVKPVSTYHFLGVLFDPRLKWKAQHERAAKTAANWINLVQRLARMTTGISAAGMRQLYLTVAVPKMAYAAKVWYTLPHKTDPSHTKRTGSIPFMRMVQAAQRRAMINMLGAMRTTAGDMLNAHADIPPPHLLFMKELIRSATRLVTLPASHPLHGPVRQTIKRTTKRHRSPLHTLFTMTKVKPVLYETILPARR